MTKICSLKDAEWLKMNKLSGKIAMVTGA